MRSICCFVVVFFIQIHVAFSQSLTITGPLSEVSVNEGDDFATDELGNPWDFNERRDIGWEENFSGPSINVNGGVWTGTNASPGGYIFPLFPGFKGSLFSEGLEGDKSLPKLGINHRINSNKYYYLSYKLNHSNRTTYAIYWEGGDNRQEYWPDPNSSRGASADVFYHWNLSYPISGYEIYSFDLRDLSGEFQQKQGSWGSNPYAFRIDPSVGGGAGAVTQLDWVRIVDPSSAPNQTVSWNSNSISPFAVVTVFYDTDASGYNGTPIARFTTGNNPGTFTFPTAMFPRGDYYFYVTAQLAAGGAMSGGITYSGYSARLKISAKPTGYITAPSMTSGEEYSSSVVGNPWDMDSANDIPNLNPAVWPDPFRQLSTPTFFTGNPDSTDGGTVFGAVADPPINGATESDVQIHLNVSKSNPIDTGKYRYLTYRIAIDENQYPTLHDKVSLGWVMRPVWWNGSFTDDHHRAKAHVLYEGWHDYGTDLADSSIMEYGSAWTSHRSFDNFRIDPLETPFNTWFYLDNVKLYSENRAPSGFYDIQYKVTDTGTGNVTTSIYYDSDKSGFDGTLITSISNQTVGNYTYRWDTSGLTAGNKYYVYMVLNNGISTVKFYSPVHLVVGPYIAPILAKPEFDFDGDSRSDQLVYRAPLPYQVVTKVKRKTVVTTVHPAANYFIGTSTTPPSSYTWGDSKYTPIYADVDGDGKDDKGLLYPVNGTMFWYYLNSGNGLTFSRQWGVPGDKVVTADYNGNGTDEVAIYRNGAWWIIDENSVGYARYWGLPNTDQPVPADYDGDGKADIAIYRKTEGNWYIVLSSSGGAITAQWGLADTGDIPVPGDFTADGKADLAVFRPTDGNWYIRDLTNDAIIIQQWGLASDIPLANHDANGDGVIDFLVYRQSNGTWYYNHRNGNVSVKQYGLPGDTLPFRVSRN